MSHSPAMENGSPATTTPSTPIMRSLSASERNTSRSPPHHHHTPKDDKQQLQQQQQQQHSLSAAIGMAHESITACVKDVNNGKPKSGHRSHANLHVTLPSSSTNTPTSTPHITNFIPDMHWHNMSHQHSPLTAPHSPGTFSSLGEAIGIDRSSDIIPSGSRLSRKESYKAQRQHYRREKKRVTSELLSSLEDPIVTILADWLKVRGTLKSWTKLWCVLKPGLLLLYKSHKAKSSHWVGTVLLTTCHVIERPSKKDGFCFKLYHPLEQSIWSPRGPHHETMGAVVQPLPTSHLIFRAPSQTAGRSWLDGLELALKSSNMLLRCGGGSGPKAVDTTTNHETQWSPEDLEKHFPEHAFKLLECIDRVERAMCSSSASAKGSSLNNLSNLSLSILKWKKIVDTFETISSNDDETIKKDDNLTLTRDTEAVEKFQDSADKILDSNSKLTFTKWMMSSVDVFKQKNHDSFNCLLRNTRRTASMMSKNDFVPKHPHDSTVTPLRFLKKRIDNPREFSPQNPFCFLEENVPKIAGAPLKRRSSTPSAIREEPTVESVESNEHILNPDSSDTVNNTLSGRKSAEPRPISILKIPHHDNIAMSVPSVVDTASKFSLINLHKLPSINVVEKKHTEDLERRSSQMMYVSGKVITEDSHLSISPPLPPLSLPSPCIDHPPFVDLDGVELSETDSEGPHDATGDYTNLMSSNDEDVAVERIRNHLALTYVPELSDDIGQSGEVVEELAEENKSLLWFLVKQVRPGMDLSKVVLPTFILEPRSFLDKLSDSFYHSDILSTACQFSDPFDRMKAVVRWYLSGLYRKPRGLKKPYNPVLGETFRCSWLHDKTGTRTYYVAEQVSHHPPVSAFYVSNRKEGFTMEATILAKSKFYGNSTSAILDGTAKLTLLPLREIYMATSPYAHCKGLLMGTLSMELGGSVSIVCPSTHYSADIEFKLKPFIGGADCINMVSGKIKHFKETVATLEGHWDDRIDIKDRRTSEESILMNVADLKGKRLKRQLINFEQQGEFESQRLWSKVSAAIQNEDQVAATEEKTIIEEAQRERARGLGGKEWMPRYFRKATSEECNAVNVFHSSEGSSGNVWLYNYSNSGCWNERVDILEYESDFVLKTLRRKSSTSSAKSINARPLTGHHPETEHSASESDSINSNHQKNIGRSVTTAFLRAETELAGVMNMVSGLDDDSGTPIRNLRSQLHDSSEGTNAASVLVALLVQQQQVSAALGRIENSLKELQSARKTTRSVGLSEHFLRDMLLTLPIYAIAYFLFRWMFS